jgi:gliding motility-associated-like protein
MRIKFLLSILWLTGSTLLFAQVPAIQNIAPKSTFSNDTIIITGSGFNAGGANMDVWFGAVRGTVLPTSSDFALEVKVPAEAKLTNVEVINKTSFLSAKSDMKFMPSLKTETFSVSKFAAPFSVTAQQELWDFCVCDLNLDGKPDVATTKFSRPSSPFLASTDLMVMQNTTTGPGGTLSFNKLDKTNLPVLNLNFATDNIQCGDLNGDGKPEMVVARGSSPRNQIYIFRNTTSGVTLSFAAPTGLLLDLNHDATRMVLRDLNKDGKPEIIVTAATVDVFYIFVNQSTGGTLTFAATPIKVDLDPATTTLRGYEPEVQDFNGDGLPDVVVNRFQEENLYFFKNTSSGTISFAAPTVLTTPTTRKFNRFSTADFNNDGKLDIMMSTSSTIAAEQVSAMYLNTSSGGNISFSPDASAINFPTSSDAWGVDASDLNGDKFPDVILAAKEGKEVNIYMHNGTTSPPSFSSKQIISTNWAMRNLKVSDMDGDGRPDILYTGFNSATGFTALEILKNNHCHQPDILNAEPLSVCNGQTLVLKTQQANGVTYAWTKDGSPVGTNSPFFTISASSAAAAGNYKVTVTTASGCSLFDAVDVTYNATAFGADPTITANTPLCVGSTLNVSTPSAGSAFVWTKPDGTTVSTQNFSLTAALTDAGEYSLQVTNNGCKSNVVTKRVDVANLANFSIASTPVNNTVCAGNAVSLSVSNLANHTYQWKKDGADVTGGTTSTLSAAQEGAYTVVVKNTTLSCQTETSPVTVTVLTSPVAAYNVKATACTSEQLAFTNSSTTDPRATPVYAWVFGDATTSTQTSPTKSYSTAQTFNTSLTVTYSGVSGCSSTTSKSIAVTTSLQPSITSTKPSLCPDSSATLSITGNFATVLWSNSATANSTTVTGPGTYTVTTTDQAGCPGTATKDITALPFPDLTATATPAKIPAGSFSQLFADITNANSAPVSYTWLPVESLNNPSINNPIAAPSATTTYIVTGLITGGCPNTAEVIVTVEGTVGFPLTFSPNGDGFYDMWDIRAQDKPDCTLSIFDGKGRRVFEGKGQNWNGTYGGAEVPAGTYYYVFGCPTEKPVTGSVLVIR